MIKSKLNKTIRKYNKKRKFYNNEKKYRKRSKEKFIAENNEKPKKYIYIYIKNFVCSA